MKKIFFFAALLSAVVLTSCGESTMSPKMFNETAMKTFMDANSVLEDFDGKITAGVTGNDLPGIATAADEALAKIDAQTEKFEAVNAPAIGEDYKAAVLVCLDGVKSIIQTGKKYADLPEGYSKAEFNALETEYNNKRQQLSADLQKVATASREFVKAANAQ